MALILSKRTALGLSRLLGVWGKLQGSIPQALQCRAQGRLEVGPKSEALPVSLHPLLSSLASPGSCALYLKSHLHYPFKPRFRSFHF